MGNSAGNTVTPAERLYRGLLAYFPGLGPKTAARLIQVFGSARTAWNHFGDDWIVPGTGIHPGQLGRWKRIYNKVGPDYLERSLSRIGAVILVPGDAGYPRQLEGVPRAPGALFALGEPAVLDRPAVTVVGSRRCTGYGRAMARRLARELVEMGCTVVSGLALGIDGESHRGALAGGGFTAAVLAAGLDRIHPRSHADLARRIAATGLLLTEYPPGVAPVPNTFRARNRIMAAAGHGLVVVEAAVRSGTNITVEWALDYGRPVMAVPGPALSPTSAGCHRLIRQGAALVETGSHVMEVLGLEGSGGRDPAPDGITVPAEPSPGSDGDTGTAGGKGPGSGRGLGATGGGGKGPGSDGGADAAKATGNKGTGPKGPGSGRGTGNKAAGPKSPAGEAAGRTPEQAQSAAGRGRKPRPQPLPKRARKPAPPPEITEKVHPGPPGLSLTPDESLLYAFHDTPVVTREHLIRKSGIGAARVSAALMRLELKGMVEHIGGETFAFTGRGPRRTT